MSLPIDDPSTRITLEMEPASTWVKDTHGSPWERVKAALQRDWEQTRADLHLGGHELKQQLSDTVKQATGKQDIPVEGLGNPDPVTTLPIWADAEPGVRYGFEARAKVADREWSDAIEVELGTGWDDTDPGRPFAEVITFVKHGWDANSKKGPKS